MVNHQKIRQLMMEKNITGKELAETVGICEGLMSRIINGLRAPSVETLVRIAGALGCTIDDLVVKQEA